jgi:hypothetical protein
MKSLKKNISIFLLLFLFAFTAKAQIEVFDKNSIEKIKNGTTYILVSDPESSDMAEYLNIFRSFWKVPKDVQFIKESDVKDKAVPGDSFISFVSLSQTSSMGATSIEFYLYLWVPDKNYFKKHRDPKLSDMDGLAKIEVSGDARMIGNAYLGTHPKDPVAINGPHVLNCYPGMIKVYLQRLEALLKAGKKVNYYDEITDNTQLKQIASTTLYCNEADFNKVTMFSAGDNLNKIKEIFEDYKFQYKLLSDKELSDKILAETKPFYFLLFVRAGAGKLICVVNSFTGEVIYLRKHAMSYNLKSGDLKSLYKDISKAK